jgi:hypothetical protein
MGKLVDEISITIEKALIERCGKLEKMLEVILFRFKSEMKKQSENKDWLFCVCTNEKCKVVSKGAKDD